jgi:FtsZ-binding cell division protein ZapB
VKQLRELLREVYNALDHRDSWLNLKPAIETALQAEVEQLKQNREIDAKHRGACHDQIDQLQAEVERLRETIKYYMDCTCEVISHPPCPKCVALTPQTDQEDK